MVCAVPDVPNQWGVVVAGGVVVCSAADRLAAAGAAVCVEGFAGFTRSRADSVPSHFMKTPFLLTAAFLLAAEIAARAFCGFYVAKADTKIFNKASQVVLVRNEDKTVMTMANDFKGDPKEFAVVIPVPT